jgi:hypothetical protein
LGNWVRRAGDNRGSTIGIVMSVRLAAAHGKATSIVGSF